MEIGKGEEVEVPLEGVFWQWANVEALYDRFGAHERDACDGQGGVYVKRKGSVSAVYAGVSEIMGNVAFGRAYQQAEDY